MDRPRHIGLNCLYLVPGEVGGSEIYARELVAALGHARPDWRFTVFCGIEAAPSLEGAGWPRNVDVAPLAFKARIKPLRIAAEMTALPRAARKAGVDLLHSLGTTAPIHAGVPSVVTILDLIYEAFPDTFPKPALMGLRAVVGPAARRADRVITISEAVKRDVVDKLGVPAERVDPVLLGRGMRDEPAPTDGPILRERLRIGEGRVVLCVSAALVHKNLPRLLEAFAVLSRRPGFEDVKLVLVGHAGLEQDRLRHRVSELDLRDRVVMTGWIEASELEGLYRMADCCAYPSLYEGFGMPVLEAMVRGVPLACSNATSLPEVAGDAAVLFDPYDTDAIRAAIERVLADDHLAAKLREDGRARAAEFTWERCAEGVVEVYERVLGG